jgi:hypothetical protein
MAPGAQFNVGYQLAGQRVTLRMDGTQMTIGTVTAEDHAFRLAVDGQVVGVVPRTTTREIHWSKAYAAHPRQGRR